MCQDQARLRRNGPKSILSFLFTSISSEPTIGSQRKERQRTNIGLKIAVEEMNKGLRKSVVLSNVEMPSPVVDIPDQ